MSEELERPFGVSAYYYPAWPGNYRGPAGVLWSGCNGTTPEEARKVAAALMAAADKADAINQGTAPGGA